MSNATEIEKLQYSVVICSYNKLDSLKIVVEAILSSGRANELILTDDGSIDGTIEWAITSGFFDKICMESKEGDYRLNTIRNNGVSLASKRFVILLDADCKPEKKFFRGHDIIFSKYPDCISVGLTPRYNSDGTVLMTGDPRGKRFKKNPICRMSWEQVYGGNIAFPKPLWQKVEGFDTDFDGAWGFEDLDFSKRIRNAGHVHFSHRLTKVRHLYHSFSSFAREGTKGKGRNSRLFEQKHGIRF